MFRKISPWAALLLLLVSNLSMGLGLGDIKLKSSLNQPLNAEIHLLSAESLTKSQIVVNLASQEEFRKAGVEHYFFLRQIRFVPIFKDNGTVVIKLTTKDSIKEPFLDFLIEVNWPNGRMIREYTVLLDPPSFTEVELTTAPEAAVSSSNNNYQPQQVDTNTIDEDDWSSDNSESSGYAAEDLTDQYRVREADTLWGIARKNRLQNTTIQQSMVAIFNANPEAFVNNNMNRLQKGSVLKIEEAFTQESLTQQQALLEISRQNQLWGGRKGSGTRPDAVLDTADYASQNASGSSSEARLKLAAVGEGDTGGDSSAYESEAVTTLSEENQSLRNRVDSQSERIDKLERLLELQNSELAVVSENAATNNSVDPLAEAENISETLDSEFQDAQNNTDVNTLDGEAISEQIGDEVLDSEQSLTTDESVITETEDAIDTTATEAVETDIADAVNTAPVIIQKKQQSFLDSILNLGTTTWVAIGSGVFVLFFSFLWIRRQNMADEDFQDSLVIPMSDNFEDDIPEVADDILAAEMGVDHDYIPESEMEQFEDDSVDMETNADPLGEADVYLAYGKFDQAERILREALKQEPDRLDLRLKIMECFAETKSLSEFNDQKREILEELATDEAVAEQVKIMERQAWPEESVANDELPSTEDIFNDLSFAEDQQHTDEVSFQNDTDTDSSSVVGDDSELDSALDMVADSTDNFSTDEFIDTELDLDSDESLDFSAASDDETQEKSADAEEGVDFISESELMDSELDDDVLEELEDEAIDESILDLGDVDEASTKLDLARAYIDMEDFEGATEILQEVVSEGSEKQKTEAEELLDRMK